MLNKQVKKHIYLLVIHKPRGSQTNLMNAAFSIGTVNFKRKRKRDENKLILVQYDHDLDILFELAFNLWIFVELKNIRCFLS